MPAEMTLADVYDMAIEIEADAGTFYSLAASACRDPENQRVLGELASMEKDHQLVFAAMKDRAASPAEAGRWAEELSLVTKLFASGIKEDLSRRFTGRESNRDLLRKALSFEKDTIVFFLHMRNMLTSQADKSRVDEIVTEELGHVILLSGALASPAFTLSKNSTYRPQPDSKSDLAT